MARRLRGRTFVLLDGDDEEEENDDDADYDEEEDYEEFEVGEAEDDGDEDRGDEAVATVAAESAAICKDDGGEEKRAIAEEEDEEEKKQELPICPVCMNHWTSEGPHRICCVPCGHVYGRSCLEKWLQRKGNKSAQCPQCNRKFKQKEIINIYAPSILVRNNGMAKELSSFKNKCENLQQELHSLQEKYKNLNAQFCDMRASKRQRRDGKGDLSHDTSWDATNTSGSLHASDVSCHTCPSFSLLNELVMSEARVMGIDAASKMVLVAGRAPGLGIEHVLTKVSLLDPQQIVRIHTPPDTKAVRDLSILPNGLAVLASLGKRLSLFSLVSNNFVIRYELPAPGWACSGDSCNPHQIYAGLQNGMLLVFDIRQTMAPLQYARGLSAQPVHTVHPASHATGMTKVLSASSAGLSMWEISGGEQIRQRLLLETERQSICIALACGSSLHPLVSSFRPKVEPTSESISSPSPSVNSVKAGYHALIRQQDNGAYYQGEQCHGSVSELRMAKSALMHLGSHAPLFAYGDEQLRGMRVWKLPSFERFVDLPPHSDPILDVRYSPRTAGDGFLGCLSEQKLQIFKVF